MGMTLKTGTIFPNKQPWISKSLKHVLSQKKLSCYEGEKKKIEAHKLVQREIKQLKSGLKVKQRMSWIKDTQGWLGKEWSPWWGCRTRTKDECDAESAEELDSFYSSFDIIDFNEELCDFRKGLVGSESHTDEVFVCKSLSGIKERKSPGPDALGGKWLKCAVRNWLGDFHTFSSPPWNNRKFPAYGNKA